MEIYGPHIGYRILPHDTLTVSHDISFIIHGAPIDAFKKLCLLPEVEAFLRVLILKNELFSKGRATLYEIRALHALADLDMTSAFNTKRYELEGKHSSFTSSMARKLALALISLFQRLDPMSLMYKAMNVIIKYEPTFIPFDKRYKIYFPNPSVRNLARRWNHRLVLGRKVRRIMDINFSKYITGTKFYGLLTGKFTFPPNTALKHNCDIMCYQDMYDSEYELKNNMVLHRDVTSWDRMLFPNVFAIQEAYTRIHYEPNVQQIMDHVLDRLLSRFSCALP